MITQKRIWNTMGVIAGNAVLAYGMAAFYIPSALAVGGSTGAGLILKELWGIDTAVSVLVINVAILVAGWVCVSREFVASTILGSLVYPLFLGVFQQLPVLEILSEDRLASVVCGACLVGFGVGLAVRAGASTGGSDSVAVICNRVLHLPVIGVKLVVDYGVMALTFLVGASGNLIYSLLALAVEIMVMNRVMLLGTAQLQLLVISEKYEQIREALLWRQETGVTMMQAETGLHRQEKQVILCVIPAKKLYRVREEIHRIDPQAFLTIAEVKEVQGQGFTCKRVPQPAAK